MRESRSIRSWVGVVVGVAVMGALRVAAAQGPAPQSLVYAVYDNEASAKQAFDAMRDSEKNGVIRIDSYAVVSKDEKGRVHVKSTQKRGARTGAIIGALIGVLGGPAGMVAGAAAGGGVGYLTGNAVGIPRERIQEIKTSLTPGSSAIIAVIDERWAASLEDSLRAAQAKQVLDYKLANPSGTNPSGTEQAPSDTGTAPAPSQQPNQNPQ
jgi:uncharacterized membrane protein